ncbi:IclR family transcriptional regulator [Allopusillimonas soli]|uniref:IclR family transcriptional regulator n=1 Tax=Allopusillimonas soli TaxID=659016 RepID=A0A853F976_9BURK|nr:IclR family transcriptional regulator [Allopusillimonas soli]NYT36499.1 IclR family transcriptional regulator [Allopusillimonas soli]TEA75002.1 IclR family transcriptional regulator [Allopusillimonas soli]
MPKSQTSSSPSAGASPKETSTVKRVLLLLRYVTDYPGESVQTLAKRLNLPRSSVHRLLATLRDHDFLTHESGGSFYPGLELYRFAAKLGGRMPYIKLAQPYLSGLSERFHETSILTLLERHRLKMFHAANGSPSDPMRYNIQLNSLETLVWGATARAILAHLTDTEIHQAIAEQTPSPVEGLLPNKNEILAALASIRHDGYAVTHSHRTQNTIGVAAPFFDSEGVVVGSLGFLIPSFRWNKPEPNQFTDALQEAAQSLSQELGYTRSMPSCDDP